jgi:hypothetical protein
MDVGWEPLPTHVLQSSTRADCKAGWLRAGALEKSVSVSQCWVTTDLNQHFVTCKGPLPPGQVHG